jgi:hypothetical protein
MPHTLNSLIDSLQRARDSMGNTAVFMQIKVSPRKWLTVEVQCTSRCHTSIVGNPQGVYLAGIHTKKENT